MLFRKCSNKTFIFPSLSRINQKSQICQICQIGHFQADHVQQAYRTLFLIPHCLRQHTLYRRGSGLCAAAACKCTAHSYGGWEGVRVMSTVCSVFACERALQLTCYSSSSTERNHTSTVKHEDNGTRCSLWRF